MYIEDKSENGLSGSARIGRVTFSKTGQSVYYRERRFKRVTGYKMNFIAVDNGDEFWISGCKKKGEDRLYPGTIDIDDDVREEYWTEIRDKPDCKDQSTIRCVGKYGGKRGQ